MGGGQASQGSPEGPWGGGGAASVPCRAFVWALTLAVRPVTQQHPLVPEL